MNPYVYVVVSILLGSAGQILMKLGTTKVDLNTQESLLLKMLHLFTTPGVVFGLMCYGISTVFWILGLTKLPLSQAYPMIAGGYVIVFLLSIFIFKEAISLPKIGGLALITVGVLIIART
jgi:multidrug transporter EmrE-like cation transporter